MFDGPFPYKARIQSPSPSLILVPQKSYLMPKFSKEEAKQFKHEQKALELSKAEVAKYDKMVEILDVIKAQSNGII